MDKNDYLRLQQRYFEARTTPSETAQLKDYVTQTDDPDFNDVRAVLSFMAMGRAIHGRTVPRRHSTRPAIILAVTSSLVAASLAAILLLRQTQTTPSRLPQDDRIASMESTLTAIFSHNGTQIENELCDFFTP